MSDKNDRNSRADELFAILEEFRAEDEPAKAKKDAAPSEQSDPAKKAEGGCGEELLPHSLTLHLSDEGETVRTAEPSADGNPHFTELTAEESARLASQPLQENGGKGDDGDGDDDDGDEEEDKNGKGKLKGFFSKISLIPKAVIYIAVVLLISAYLSYYIITIGNDVFALVTDSREVTVVLGDSETDESVAKLLEEKGIIQYGWVYELYMKYRSDGEETKYVAGMYQLNTDLNYSQLITLLTSVRKERHELRITIPEGFTVDQIIDLFVANGLGTREGYVEAINNYPYKHEFVRLLDERGYSSDRIYRLEGYLYPDTYDFYSDTSEVYVINKLLNNFNNKFWRDFVKENDDGDSYRNMCLDEYSLDFDDVIVLASMIQAEGKTALDFECISYVFHNRLEHPTTFPCLESDATIQYILEERETDSSQIDISIDNPYNTYKYEGLPPGAVCNAGLDSLMAAMFPSAPLDSRDREINAYYFVSNNAGKTYYASSLSGHQSNVEQVKKDNEAIEAGTYN